MRMGERDIGLCHLGDFIHAPFGRFGGGAFWVGTRPRGCASIVGMGYARATNDGKQIITVRIAGAREGQFIRQRLTGSVEHRTWA